MDKQKTSIRSVREAISKAQTAFANGHLDEYKPINSAETTNFKRLTRDDVAWGPMMRSG